MWSSPAVLLSAMFIAVMMIGCADNPKGAGPTTRTSDAALTDPYGKWSKVDTNISGSDTGKPEKGGWKDDLDRFLMK